VLRVLRDCLSGQVLLLAKSLLSATEADLSGLIDSAQAALGVPIVAVVSDGQHSIRNAVKRSRCRACRTTCATSTTCARRAGRRWTPAG
jgi:hypothetical protein